MDHLGLERPILDHLGLGSPPGSPGPWKVTGYLGLGKFLGHLSLEKALGISFAYDLCT